MTVQASDLSTAAPYVPYNDDWEYMSEDRKARLALLGENMSDPTFNRCGKEFKKISDEFHQLLDEGMKGNPWYEGMFGKPLATSQVNAPLDSLPDQQTQQGTLCPSASSSYASRSNAGSIGDKSEQAESLPRSTSSQKSFIASPPSIIAVVPFRYPHSLARRCQATLDHNHFPSSHWSSHFNSLVC